jgi:hypothetical protein
LFQLLNTTLQTMMLLPDAVVMNRDKMKIPCSMKGKDRGRDETDAKLFLDFSAMF